ncbi:MAG: SCP2 sterol-binding domain-containing protein [Acidimicrobiales bacterium]
MPRFYSKEWIASFNEAVADLAPAGDAAGGEELGTVGGRARYRVAQLVSGSPDGELRIVLEVAGDRLRLERIAPGGGDLAPGHGDGTGAEPDVTVVLSYEDAAALSRGELDAARMVGTGRLKVRGNLSLLVAGQALLAAAADRLAPLAASTTY